MSRLSTNESNLASEYLPLTEGIVGMFMKTTPVHLHGEIRSAGFHGLNKAIGKLDEQHDRVKAFVGCCVKNAIYDVLRKTQRHSEIMEMTDQLEQGQSGIDITGQRSVDELVDLRRRMELVLSLLDNERAKGIFELRFRGHTLKEIGDEFNLSVPSISRIISEGKSQVILALEERSEKLAA